jgi:chromosome segregation ATPase
VQRLSSVVETGQAEITTLGAEFALLRGQIGELARAVQGRLAERLAGEKDVERAGQEHDRVQRHVETIETESRQVAREAEETSTTLAQLSQRIAVARDAEGALDAAAARVRDAIESAQSDETALGAELTACRVDLASVTERVEALGRELIRVDEIERDLTDRLAQAGQRRTQLGERRAWLTEERERTDVAAREVAVERDRTDAEARVAGEHHEGLAAELRAVELESRGAESELGRLVASAHEIDIRATECRVRREELGQEAWRVYGVDAQTLLAHHDPSASSRQCESAWRSSRSGCSRSAP